MTSEEQLNQLAANPKWKLLKMDLAAALLANIKDKPLMSVKELDNEYKENNGQPIPYRMFGFATVEDLLDAMPDKISVGVDLSVGAQSAIQLVRRGGGTLLRMVQQDETRHLAGLISGQRGNPKRRASSAAMRGREPPPSQQQRRRGASASAGFRGAFRGRPTAAPSFARSSAVRPSSRARPLSQSAPLQFSGSNGFRASSGWPAAPSKPSFSVSNGFAEANRWPQPQQQPSAGVSASKEQIRGRIVDLLRSLGGESTKHRLFEEYSRKFGATINSQHDFGCVSSELFPRFFAGIVEQLTNEEGQIVVRLCGAAVIAPQRQQQLPPRLQQQQAQRAAFPTAAFGSAFSRAVDSTRPIVGRGFASSSTAHAFSRSAAAFSGNSRPTYEASELQRLDKVASASAPRVTSPDSGLGHSPPTPVALPVERITPMQLGERVKQILFEHRDGIRLSQFDEVYARKFPRIDTMVLFRKTWEEFFSRTFVSVRVLNALSTGEAQTFVEVWGENVRLRPSLVAHMALQQPQASAPTAAPPPPLPMPAQVSQQLSQLRVSVNADDERSVAQSADAVCTVFAAVPPARPSKHPFRRQTSRARDQWPSSPKLPTAGASSPFPSSSQRVEQHSVVKVDSAVDSGRSFVITAKSSIASTSSTDWPAGRTTVTTRPRPTPSPLAPSPVAATTTRAPAAAATATKPWTLEQIYDEAQRRPLQIEEVTDLMNRSYADVLQEIVVRQRGRFDFDHTSKTIRAFGAAPKPKSEPLKPSWEFVSSDFKFAVQPLPFDLCQIDARDLDRYLQVLVSQFVSPHLFYMQLFEQSAELEQLYAKMDAFYGGEGAGVETRLPESDAAPSVVCAAVCASYGFHRCRIVDVDDSGLATLFYVDYGTQDVVALGELRRLRADFARAMPAQAIRATLPNVHYGDAADSNERAQSLFRRLVEVDGLSTFAFVRSVDEQDVVEVELTFIGADDSESHFSSLLNAELAGGVDVAFDQPLVGDEFDDLCDDDLFDAGDDDEVAAASAAPDNQRKFVDDFRQNWLAGTIDKDMGVIIVKTLENQKRMKIREIEEIDGDNDERLVALVQDHSQLDGIQSEIDTIMRDCSNPSVLEE